MSSPINQPKVIAIGGAGLRIASRLSSLGLSGYNIFGLDLGSASASFPVLPLGCSTFDILGNSGDTEVALQSAHDKKSDILSQLQDVPVVFIIAGLGGATGSAVAPFVAQQAVQHGSLVVAFVSLPFAVEGARRATQAKESLAELKSLGAIVIPLPGDLFARLSDGTPAGALSAIDHAISRGIRGIAGAIYTPGLTEIDFASLRSAALQAKGAKTLFAYAESTGENALTHLFNDLTGHLLLQANEMARSADHLLLCLKVSNDIGLKEINLITQQLAEKFGIRGERFVGAILEPQWTDSRIEAVVIGLPDAELRRRHQAALQSANLGKNNKDKAKEKDATTPTNAQAEFTFNHLPQQRGFFENTDPTLYQGVDLDVPTYLRRGVKVVL